MFPSRVYRRSRQSLRYGRESDEGIPNFLVTRHLVSYILLFCYDNISTAFIQ